MLVKEFAPVGDALLPKKFEATTPLPDVLEMYVAKKIYSGWKDASFTREINAAASDFQLEVVDVWETNKEPWRLAPGEATRFTVAGKPILTGHIEKTAASVSADQRRITVEGRSKTGDLVDCSVLGVESQYSGLTIKDIAQKVCKPFSITTKFLGAFGSAFSDVKIESSETAFQLLDRLARQRKLVIYPDVDGTLVFAPPGIKRAATELVQGINVKSGNVTWDHSNRFSIYKTKSNANDLSWMKEGPSKEQPEGEATDAAITRYRPLMLINEISGDDEIVRDRAAYEASLRAAQALGAEVEVQGWFQAPGRLWEINEIVKCDIGFLGIKKSMLVRKVAFKKNDTGTTTTISLILPGALDFSAKKKKTDEQNLSWIQTLDRKADSGDAGAGFKR